jgi:hypothetical protein
MDANTPAPSRKRSRIRSKGSHVEESLIRRTLNLYYSPEQDHLIEVFFESSFWVNGPIEYFILKIKYSPLMDKYPRDRQEKLRIIHENIMVNMGSFVPEKVPVLQNGKWVTPGFNPKWLK